MNSRSEFPFQYEVVLAYANEKSESRLIKNSSSGFLIWSWVVILPFIYFGVVNTLMSYALVLSAILASINAIITIIIADKKRKIAILLFGVESFIMSIIHFLLVIRMVYFEAGYNSKLLIGSLILGYFVMLLSLAYYHFHSLMQDKYRKKKQKAAIAGALIPILSPLGLAVGRSLKGIEQNIAILIMAICFLFFALVFLLGTHNVYKYILIKKYKIEFK